jgi:phage recombination protein Bet
MNRSLVALEEDRLPALSAWTEERVSLLRRTLCKEASDEELEMFLGVCKRTGLDPFLRQLHAVMRFDKNAGRKIMTIQVGIDGFRLLADRTGHYVPGRDATFTYDEKGGLISATAYVKKLVAGEWHEVAATVRWDEFHADSNFWRTMPHHQLGKVAEAHALRRAFPADLSGLYTTDEMAQADNRPLVHYDTTTGEIMEPAALPPAPPTERERLTRELGREKDRAKRLGVEFTAPRREASDAELAEALRLQRMVNDEAEAETEQPAAPAGETPQSMACSVCEKVLTRGQYDVSLRAYNAPLCPVHQKEAQAQKAAA